MSAGVTGEPIQELFDFQRAADVAPGQSVMLVFTLPLSVATMVDAEGSHVLVPGTFEVRIGDVKESGNYARGTITIAGDKPVVVSKLNNGRALKEV